jgi:hypothetical protein
MACPSVSLPLASCAMALPSSAKLTEDRQWLTDQLLAGSSEKAGEGLI